MAVQLRKCEIFKDLHASGRGFVMPNAWDAGSAILLAYEGFAAIATTSAGIAFSLGRPDYDSRHPELAVGRAEMMDRLRAIAGCVPLPVNGDLEAGYGDDPETVAQTVRMAIDAGLAGGNIEDKDPAAHRLYDEALAVARVRAARAAIDASGAKFVLTARTDAFLVSPENAMAISVRRANLFREAGADCLYPPGVADLDAVRTLLREIDGPLNIVTGLGAARMNTRELLDAGATRISVGGAIARASLGFIRASVRELRDDGMIGAPQIGQGELNTLFVRARSGG